MARALQHLVQLAEHGFATDADKTLPLADPVLLQWGTAREIFGKADD